MPTSIRFVTPSVLLIVALFGSTSCSKKDAVETIDWDAPLPTPIPTRTVYRLPTPTAVPEVVRPAPKTIKANPIPLTPVVLFDGTDTKEFSNLQGFTLENGLLKGTGKLISAKPFSNYELRLELRFTKEVTHLTLNRIGFQPVLGSEPQTQAVGQWLDVRTVYRHLPGEQPKLTVPQVNFAQYGGSGKKFDDRNILPAAELPRDSNGFVAGVPQVFLTFPTPVEIRRITLRALDPESPREFFELQGPAYTTFLAEGKDLYRTYCVSCHNDGTGAALSPVNRSLGIDVMQNGSDRLSLYQTLTDGYKTMVAMPHLSEEERHQVSAYVSDVLFKNHNPSQYQPVDPETIATLPFPLYTAQEEFERRNKPKDLIQKERGTFRDLGPIVISPFDTPYRNAAHVLLDENSAISYDLYGMNQINVRTDGFLDMLKSQHFNQRPSSVTLPAGKPIGALGTWFWRQNGPVRAPDKGLRTVPQESGYVFKGYYLHERTGIFSYEVHGRHVLERPSVVSYSTPLIVRHQLQVDPGNQDLQLVLAQGVTITPTLLPEALQTISGRDGKFSLRLYGNTEGLRYRVEEGHLILNIPASEMTREFLLVRAEGQLSSRAVRSLKLGTPLADCISGGKRRWPKTYTLPGVVSKENAAYVMDTLPVPYENDYNAWMRTTSVAFFPDGRAVVTTYGGDVWIVSGIDDELKAVTWSRFAAGLYEPFGVKVVDGLIYVTTRNGIVRLHDANEDGEADYYEQFFADPEVSSNWHGYNFDLIRDDKGFFYYAKAGQFTDIQMEGGALKVSPDGKDYHVLATGFRTPNGMGKLPDGRMTYGENQGGWVPAGKIAILEEGSWHGGAVTTSPVDREPAPPLICFPQEVDNSCGGQLWIDDERFGPYANRLMHTSCGHARAMMIFLDEFGETHQAATQSFPFKFDSGVMRLATNPQDGQVYLTGTRGWQINAPKDGNLQRIRYTGNEEPLLMHVQARTGGILLRFNTPIDPASLDPAQFQVRAWNYKRAKSYGSQNYRPSAPAEKGKDLWNVQAVQVMDDPTRLWIALPDSMPAHQVRVDYALGFASGTTLKNSIHLTINALKPL